MPSKWDSFQSAVERAHDDLFFSSEYTATFYNRNSGSYDPDTGTMENQTRSELASFDVEIVPPGMDTTVDVDGTGLDFTTSIRFPQNEVSEDDLIPLGDDNRRPTEVEISNPQESDNDVYELHGYTYEKGSEMYLCRLVEQ